MSDAAQRRGSPVSKSYQRGPLFIAALVAGTTYLPADWLLPHGPLLVAWKGAGVGLLALWAASRARGLDGWWITAVMALGALGDVLIDAVGLTAGALAFLTGHVLAIILYLRHRRDEPWAKAAPIALGRLIIIPVLAFQFPADRAAAPGIALYAVGLGAMAASAWLSNFPRSLVSKGALLFSVSDLLIFARLGPLAGSWLPTVLIWPLYFAGQVLIADGVVGAIAKKRL